MFGVVPKPLWEKRATPDERNRSRRRCAAPFACQGTGQAGRLMIIDAAPGTVDPRTIEIHGFDRAEHLDVTLGARVRRSRSSRRRTCTSTHAGGFTVKDASGPSGRSSPCTLHREPGEGRCDAYAQGNRASYSRRTSSRCTTRAWWISLDGARTWRPVTGRRTGGLRFHQIVHIESGEDGGNAVT
jgi:hypothetical protein